jgi:hypothetical protein
VRVYLAQKMSGEFCDTLVRRAAKELDRLYGTWWKRTKWRIAMYRRCRIKALIDEVRGWL